MPVAGGERHGAGRQRTCGPRPRVLGAGAFLEGQRLDAEVHGGDVTTGERAAPVADGQIEARDVMDLTIVIDYNVVDGAPATRFAAQLRELIETAAVISSSGQAAT
jgi:hypothetical protein